MEERATVLKEYCIFLFVFLWINTPYIKEKNIQRVSIPDCSSVIGVTCIVRQERYKEMIELLCVFTVLMAYWKKGVRDGLALEFKLLLKYTLNWHADWSSCHNWHNDIL